MQYAVLVAIVAALLNMFLSTVMPCVLDKAQMPFLTKARTVFTNNKQLILVSSFIVGVTVYLAVKVSPFLDMETGIFDSPAFSDTSFFSSLSTPRMSNRMPIIVSGNLPMPLANLARLREN